MIRFRSLGFFTLCLLIACTSAGPSKSGSSTEGSSGDLTFEYTSIAEIGFIDQALSIGNRSPSTLAPTLRLEALDRDGEVLKDVTVTTVFGSDYGKVVIPPGGTIDILRFSPTSRIKDVADVAVSVTDVREVPPSGTQQVVMKPLSTSGEQPDAFSNFASVEISNPNPQPATVCVVLLIYDDPPPGRSQQAETVLRVAGPVAVGGQSSSVTEVSTEFSQATIDEAAIVSLKPYFCTG